MTKPEVYERSTDVVWRMTSDRVLLLPLACSAGSATRGESASVTELSGVYALVWSVLDEPGTLEALSQRLPTGVADDDSLAKAVAVMLEGSWIDVTSR